MAGGKAAFGGRGGIVNGKRRRTGATLGKQRADADGGLCVSAIRRVVKPALDARGRRLP